MAAHYDAVQTHWNYFLALERDFSEIARFVEPCRENEDTYSIELSRLLMTASQEVDVVIKALCKLLEPASDASGINQYFSVISSHLPEFKQQEVRISRHNISVRPWSSWEDQNPPLWWTANNKIKHHRETQYHQANLKNAYTALAGLHVVVNYYYRQKLLNQDPATKWSKVTGLLDSQLELFRFPSEFYTQAIVMGSRH